MSDPQAERPPAGSQVVDQHLLRMRVVAVVGAFLPALLAVLSFFLPRARSALLSPTAMTLVAAAAGAWIVFTANGHAHRRLEAVKRGFAAHGDVKILLRDHLRVYVAVLARLLCVALCGLVAAGWGNGPVTGLCFFLVAILLVGTTWPTRRKTELLIARAAAAR